MSESMDSYRSRFENYRIPRSRSPSCWSFLNRDPQNHRMKFLKLRHARHNSQKEISTPHQSFNFTPILPQSDTFDHPDNPFSYDDQLLSKDFSRLIGLVDLDPSAQKLDLDDIIGHLSSRDSSESSSLCDLNAHHTSPASDHHAHQRSSSIPAPSDSRSDSVRFEIPSGVDRITRQRIDSVSYEPQSDQSNQNPASHQVQSPPVMNGEIDNNHNHRASHEGKFCTQKDGHQNTVERSPTRDRQGIMDPVFSLKGAPTMNSAGDGSTEVDERLALNRVLYIKFNPSSLETVPMNPTDLEQDQLDFNASLVHDPLHPSNQVATAPPSDISSPTQSPNFIGHRREFHGQLDSDTPLRNYPHHPQQPSSSSVIGPATPITSNLSNSSPPPQAYPGKANPLLPPPLPSSKPSYQISFPRPFRRTLSPLAVPLPPSPPPEFDFSSFENSLNLSSCNLLDDSPYMPVPEKPSDFGPLIDWEPDGPNLA